MEVVSWKDIFSLDVYLDRRHHCIYSIVEGGGEIPKNTATFPLYDERTMISARLITRISSPCGNSHISPSYDHWAFPSGLHDV